MGQYFEKIHRAVSENRYVLSTHATERLRERRIPEWQAAAGVAEAQLVEERPNDLPNPSVEMRQVLPDGTPVLAVWAWLRLSNAARLVTIHFFDR